MNVIVAKSAGFCFGVRRAVNTVYEQAGKETVLRPIYTCGPIIHNEEVVKDLEQKGVQVINHISQLAGLEPGIVIIRSHGVSRQTIQAIEEAGFETIDATCPFVKKIHRIVELLEKRPEQDGEKIVEKLFPDNALGDLDGRLRPAPPPAEMSEYHSAERSFYDFRG